MKNSQWWSLNINLFLIFSVFITPLFAIEPKVQLPLNKNTVLAPQAIALDKRFRIDKFSKEINLLIERQFNSSPVVVITPDGTKWYSDRHPENVSWMDGLNGDIISIKNPEPGPYQLIGSVVKNSLISLVSELKIDIETLPQPLYQGEQIKTYAKLIGGNKLIRMPGLDYLVEWRANLVSTKELNKTLPKDAFIIGDYNDHGETSDDISDDGIFTGTLDLNQDVGKYQFLVTAKNKAFTRKKAIDLEIVESPIKLSAQEPNDHEFGNWKLLITIDKKQVLTANTQVELEVFGPNNSINNMLLKKLIPGKNLIALDEISEFGSYRIVANILSKTLDGRNIFLNVPEIYLNKIKPVLNEPSQQELDLIAAKEAITEKENHIKNAQMAAVAFNLALLLFGVIIVIIRWRLKVKAQRRLEAERRAQLKAEAEALEKQKEAEKENIFDDIDLSLPETEQDEENVVAE